MDRVDTADRVEKVSSVGRKSTSSLTTWLARREILLMVLIVVIALVVRSLHPDFFKLRNLEFILLNSVVLGLIAMGQTFVILSKGIDLSVAPIMGLSAVVTGMMSTKQGLPLWTAVLLSLAIGLVLGMFNGWLISLIRIPPIIATLGTLSLYGGLMFIYTNGVQVTSVPSSYAQFGNGFLLPGLPTPVVILFAVALGCWFVLRYTIFGRNVYAVGNNYDAARNAGVPVRSTVFFSYAISGLLAGFAGLIYVAYTAAATATTGTGDNIELQSIAAALIGGTAVAGGRGNAFGSLLGSIFMTLVLTGLIFMRVPAIWNSAGEGVLILVAVMADVFMNARRKQKALGGLA